MKETITRLGDRAFDNTLIGAQTQTKEFSSYRSSEKPPKSAEKHAVLTLHKTIVRTLEESPHHRPAFVPPEGLAPEDINKLWNNLEEAEKAREDFLKTELKRFFSFLKGIDLIILDKKSCMHFRGNSLKRL